MAKGLSAPTNTQWFTYARRAWKFERSPFVEATEPVSEPVPETQST